MENLKNRSAVIVTLDDLNEMSINAGIEALKRFKEIENEGKVYNTHQAAKLLGKHFTLLPKRESDFSSINSILITKSCPKFC